MAWRFSGIGDDHLEDVVLEGVGNGDRALQRVHGNHLRCVRGHAGRGDVDELEVVAGGEHAGDTVRRRGTFLDQGIRDRGALGGAPANERELRPDPTSSVEPRRSRTSSAVSLTPNGAASCCPEVCSDPEGRSFMRCRSWAASLEGVIGSVTATA